MQYKLYKKPWKFFYSFLAINFYEDFSFYLLLLYVENFLARKLRFQSKKFISLYHRGKSTYNNIIKLSENISIQIVRRNSFFVVVVVVLACYINLITLKRNADCSLSFLFFRYFIFVIFLDFCEHAYTFQLLPKKVRKWKESNIKLQTNWRNIFHHSLYFGFNKLQKKMIIIMITLSLFLLFNSEMNLI